MCGAIIISETHQNRVRIPLYYSGHEFYEEDGYKIVVKLKKRRPKTSFPAMGILAPLHYNYLISVLNVNSRYYISQISTIAVENLLSEVVWAPVILRRTRFSAHISCKDDRLLPAYIA